MSTGVYGEQTDDAKILNKGKKADYNFYRDQLKAMKILHSTNQAEPRKTGRQE